MAQEHTRLMKANFHGSELGINGSEVYTATTVMVDWIKRYKVCVLIRNNLVCRGVEGAAGY